MFLPVSVPVFTRGVSYVIFEHSVKIGYAVKACLCCYLGNRIFGVVKKRCGIVCSFVVNIITVAFSYLSLEF